MCQVPSLYDIWQILWKGGFLPPPHTWVTPKRLILNRINGIFIPSLLSIHKTFFGRVCFLMMHFTWQNFAREKWRHEVGKIIRSFVFVLTWILVFMYQGSQPRIYADLLGFQSRVKDPINKIKLMKSIIPFFIHSFYVLTLVYEQKKSENNM